MSVLGASLSVLLLLFVALGHRLAETRKTTLRVPALDLAEWTRIAGDLEDRVPARFLLGGSGANAALDNVLVTRGVRRADFQRLASQVVRKVGENADAVAGEALMAAFSLYPLPEGIEIPDVRARDAIDPSSELEEARRLVLTLTARLDSPVPETETL